VSMADYENGIYLVRIESDEGVLQKKVLNFK